MPEFCTNCGAPHGRRILWTMRTARSSNERASTRPVSARATAASASGTAACCAAQIFQQGAADHRRSLCWWRSWRHLARRCTVSTGLKNKLSSLTGGALGQAEVAQGNACKLLSPAELQQVLGVTVERSAEIMEGREPGCAYFTNPAAFAELQKIAVEQARRDSEKASKDPALNNSKSDNPLELLKHTQEMEGIVKGLRT